MKLSRHRIGLLGGVALAITVGLAMRSAASPALLDAVPTGSEATAMPHEDAPADARQVMMGATWVARTAGTLVAVLHTVSLVIPQTAN